VDISHDDLCCIAERWLLKAKGCSFAFKEFVSLGTYGEIPDAIGFRSGISILVECKASRSDFLSDKKKIFRRNPSKGMGTFRFFMCPAGLIHPDDLPERWGLVWVSDKGKATQKVGPKGNSSFHGGSPFCFSEKSTQSEYLMMCSALRRLHLRGVFKQIYDKLGPVER